MGGVGPKQTDVYGGEKEISEARCWGLGEKQPALRWRCHREGHLPALQPTFVWRCLTGWGGGVVGVYFFISEEREAHLQHLC